jgi:hypothetical protein
MRPYGYSLYGTCKEPDVRIFQGSPKGPQGPSEIFVFGSIKLFFVFFLKKKCLMLFPEEEKSKWAKRLGPVL